MNETLRDDLQAVLWATPSRVVVCLDRADWEALIHEARGSSQAGSAPAGTHEKLAKLGYLLAVKARFVEADRTWNGAPFAGTVTAYRPDDIREIRGLLDEVTVETAPDAPRGAGSAGSPEVSDALALIRRALAMRDYGDKPDIWEQVWKDVEDAARRLGNALAVGAASPSSGEPQ